MCLPKVAVLFALAALLTGAHADPAGQPSRSAEEAKAEQEFASTIKAEPGESAVELQARRDYEVTVWKWKRMMAAGQRVRDARRKIMAQMRETMTKAGTWNDSSERFYNAQIAQLNDADTAAIMQRLDFDKRDAMSAKSPTKAADRAAIVVDLQKQIQAASASSPSSGSPDSK